jgi:chromosome segregation ATPase
LESARGALDEFDAGQDDFERFFGHVFDELQSLSLELFARHKCLELATGQQEQQATAAAESRGQFQLLLDEMQQARTECRAGREETQQAWAQWQAAHDTARREQAELRDFQEEMRRAWTEFRAAQDETQKHRAELHDVQQSVQEHLARLAAVAAELAEARTQPAQSADPAQQQQVQQLLEESRQQRGAWELERATLETELQAVRNRATDLMEALAEQKRQAAQQQGEFAGELKRLRSLLEAVATQMRGEAMARQAAGKHNEAAAEAADDPVFDSVLAQFEMLQQDVSRRRLSKAKNHDG